MLKLSGKSVCKGTAMGKILVYKRQDIPVKQWETSDPKGEVARLDAAMKETKEQLETLYEHALVTAGEAGAEIFRAHQLVLEEKIYRDSICNLIRGKLLNAEKAVELAGDKFADRFEHMHEEAMQIRAADIRDISKRVIRNLMGEKDLSYALTHPVILITDDLSPSETVLIDRENVLAIVTREGSVNSHAAILARMMNIPAVAGVPVALEHIKTGMQAVVDGRAGVLILNPDDRICLNAKKQIQEEEEQNQLLHDLQGKESKTRSGRLVRVCANAAGIQDVEQALEHNADGIGLFRSESICFNRGMFPGEESQFQIYKQILERMQERKVVIRTMDLGSDKKVSYMKFDQEMNPALGCRGIRICLEQPDFFKIQLRALLRAAVYGKLAIMYPMISRAEEVDRIQAVLKEVKKELFDKGIPFKVPEQGIMIETPSAALISDELAKKVDFFSIGTNDLTQFTLAVDRQNRTLEHMFDDTHKAVLRLIQMSIDAAHGEQKRVTICGELASDPQMTAQLIKMGVDELSVEPSMVLKIRKAVCEAE